LSGCPVIKTLQTIRKERQVQLFGLASTFFYAFEDLNWSSFKIQKDWLDDTKGACFLYSSAFEEGTGLFVIPCNEQAEYQSIGLHGLVLDGFRPSRNFPIISPILSRRSDPWQLLLFLVIHLSAFTTQHVNM
jgi:hypothetical protein